MVNPVREMKVWQHGYDYAYLAELEHRFQAHNAYARGPFSEMNKPQVAQKLHDGTLAVLPFGVVDTVFPRWSQTLTCYQDVVIAQAIPGDRIVRAFCYEDKLAMIQHLESFDEPTYIWIWQESPTEREVVEAAGYTWVGSKITSFAEIKGLYFREGECMFPRTHPALPECEELGIARAAIKVNPLMLLEAVKEIETLTRDWTDHYSNYNKKHSWSALSLRGYHDDPAMIIKPSEMNKKWHAENPNDFELQDTPLRAELPAVDALHRPLTSLATPHRIRLMKLAPGGGELRRHTDLVDKDSGIADGKVARFHIPIITNDRVTFGSWNFYGQESTVNMRAGECWYLDTRKPHTAINNGDTDRVHLVVDVEANALIRSLFS